MAAAIPGVAGEVRVAQARRLRGRVRVPGDKSVTHRALILSALAEGESVVGGGSDALDCLSTAACLSALGVHVERLHGESGRVDWNVRSRGRAHFARPPAPLDCGNSGTTLRLLAGVLASSPFEAILDGDASLRRRPVARIIEPLRSMGATLRARERDTVPPLRVVGRTPLRAIDYAIPVSSAQVKSAVLLAALAAEGRTTVREAVRTRDHTERMLRARGVAVETGVDDEGRSTVSVEGESSVEPLDERVPGDVSAAAFWLVAGAIHPDAELVIDNAGVNPTRRAVIELLRRMGARIDERPDPASGSEPTAELTVRSSALEAIEISGAETAAAIDEIPALCLAAAFARGTTVVRATGELRHKESDRVAGIAAGLTALGAEVELRGDDVFVQGRGRRNDGPLRGADVHTAGDHRLAMTFAVAGLVASGETRVSDAQSAAVSYPGFFADLERIRA